MSVFDLAKAETWINDMREALDVEDEERAYLALRAGLHALRDRLTVEEAAHLAAQLPTTIRGVFFEGWHPGGKRDHDRSLASFLDAIEREMPHCKVAPLRIARAVFKLLEKHVSQGLLENVRHLLPRHIADLWEPPVALP